jgi:hypothetical protein
MSQDIAKNAPGFLLLSAAGLRMIRYADLSRATVKNALPGLVARFVRKGQLGEFVLNVQLARCAPLVRMDESIVTLLAVVSIART